MGRSARAPQLQWHVLPAATGEQEEPDHLHDRSIGDARSAATPSDRLFGGQERLQSSKTAFGIRASAILAPSKVYVDLEGLGAKSVPNRVFQSLLAMPSIAKTRGRSPFGAMPRE